MDEKLIETLKYLRLSTLLEKWDEYVVLAGKKGLSHAQWLSTILQDEYQIKRERSRALKIKQAHIPEPLVIETFPFHRQPRLNKAKVFALYDSLSYLKKSENIVWLGATGTGKTGLATGFLIQAIKSGYSARYIQFVDLLTELYRSVADQSQKKVLRQYASFDCLLIDEIGYIEVEPVQVGLFFTLMQERHKKKSTLITSNLGFDDWRSFLKNDHLTSALLDRLTENSHVFNMRHCKSLRPKLSED